MDRLSRALIPPPRIDPRPDDNADAGDWFHAAPMRASEGVHSALALEIQPDIENRRAVGDPADGDKIDTGGGNGGRRLRIDAA